MRNDRTCRMCGEKTPVNGGVRLLIVHSDDLDMRSGEISRSLSDKIQRCPHCGCVASDIEEYETSATPEWIASEEYLDLDGLFPKGEALDSNLAVQFYRFHKLALHDGDAKTAAHALLHVAWCYDDQHQPDRAREFRKMSIPLFEEAIREDPDDTETQLVLLDVKRRAGMFDQVQEDYHEGMFGIDLLDEDSADRIVSTQLRLAREGDDERHTMSEVPSSFVSQVTPIATAGGFLVTSLVLIAVIALVVRKLGKVRDETGA